MTAVGSLACIPIGGLTAVVIVPVLFLSTATASPALLIILRDRRR